MITKCQALKCVKHHKACDCREYEYQEMLSALKVIHTWASVALKYYRYTTQYKLNSHTELKHIMDKAEKALQKAK